MSADIAEERLHGVWELESWRRTSKDGTVSAPYTDRPLGRIIYEPGGRMAAFMMHPAWPQAEVERGAASYGGLYRVENGEVHHLVDFANNRALIGADLVRSIAWDGDRLLLSCPAVNEPGAREELVWRPAPAVGDKR